MRVPPLIKRALVACAVAGGVCVFASPAAAQSKKKVPPEIFHGKAKVAVAGVASADALVTIQIDEYTPEKDIKAMEQALQSGGAAAFVEALRKAPVAGQFKVGDRSFAIRWARRQPTTSGYTISAVVEKPVVFVGAGAPGAKARAGYDVAVLRLDMDSAHVGEGTMAAAAKVKPGGETGVEVEDYATEPIKLVSVMKVIS